MEEQHITHSEHRTFDKTRLILPGAILLAAIMVSGSLLYARASSKGSATVGQQQQPSKSADISKVKTSGQPFIGNTNAPVSVAYWYDYQCPFCKRTEESVMPQLIKDYVDTGKVKIVYKDYQFLGADSTTAGTAARAVWEVAPDKFYAFHKAMYDKQDNENSGWGKKADILALIRTIPGIDATKVEQLMTTKASEYQKALDADKTEGDGFGISGTPSTIIGTQLIVGAQPYEVFKAAIDETLKK